jgi:catechol 2,3-dioxygenase-like lactoylglutathione lyase family enzyme
MEQQMPVLEQVNIVTGNFSRSLDFYSRLGVKFPSLGDDPTGDHFHVNGETSNELRVELDSAAFARVWNQGWSASPDLQGRIVLGFSVATRDDVDRLYAELTGASFAGLAPPYDAFWGARYAIVEDPNGVAVGVMSPIDPARKTWPPAGWPA